MATKRFDVFAVLLIATVGVATSGKIRRQDLSADLLLFAPPLVHAACRVKNANSGETIVDKVCRCGKDSVRCDVGPVTVGDIELVFCDKLRDQSLDYLLVMNFACDPGRPGCGPGTICDIGPVRYRNTEYYLCVEPTAPGYAISGDTCSPFDADADPSRENEAAPPTSEPLEPPKRPNPNITFSRPKQPDTADNEPEQPDTANNWPEQPDTANNEPEQPDTANNWPEQPDTANNWPEQPDTANNWPEQPDTANNEPEQPDTANNEPEQPDTANNEPEQPGTADNEPEQPDIASNIPEQPNIPNGSPEQPNTPDIPTDNGNPTDTSSDESDPDVPAWNPPVLPPGGAVVPPWMSPLPPRRTPPRVGMTSAIGHHHQPRPGRTNRKRPKHHGAPARSSGAARRPPPPKQPMARRAGVRRYG